MSRPKFDNLHDITSKFVGTVCYFDNEPVYVKTAFHLDDDPNEFRLSVAPLAKNSLIVDVHDPKFRYVDYNLGYSNHNTTAYWWYRRPAKQYQQGLKSDQLRCFNPNPYDNPKASFQFSKPYVDMLRNNYMPRSMALNATAEGGMNIAAWHRDFAFAYNPNAKHHDIYYRANKIGSYSNGKTFLSPQAMYVQEALQEALAQCNN